MPDDAFTQSQELHRFLFEHAVDAVAVLAVDGHVALANHAARELRGIPLERLFAATASWAPMIGELRAQARQAGQATIELPITTLQGGPRQIELRATPHGAQDVIVIRDVTRVRELESELRHLRRIESMGHLTASVVHDFNNLLTPIVCLSGLLEKELKEGDAGEDDARHAEFASDVRAASERAAGLVRQMLAFTRRAPTRPQRVHVGSVVAELRPLAERVAGPGITLELVTEDDAADAVIDREQLDHVLLNLVANARDAMPRGGKLTIKTACIDLDAASAGAIEGSTQGAYVVVTVTDTGVGMTSEVRERIFERFFTTKAIGEGTGLGLATARSFVAESKGCIRVHSEPGRGTTVAIYLPRAQAPAVSSSSANLRAEPPRGTESVLLVDDDRAVRGAMRAVLEELGYTVHDAGSADEALAVAHRREVGVDLVVVDVVLGSASGREVARKIRAARPEAKVLYTSGHTTRVLDKHGIAEGDPCLLRKAFTPSALARKVRAVLDANVCHGGPTTVREGSLASGTR